MVAKQLCQCMREGMRRNKADLRRAWVERFLRPSRRNESYVQYRLSVHIQHVDVAYTLDQNLLKDVFAISIVATWLVEHGLIPFQSLLESSISKVHFSNRTGSLLQPDSPDRQQSRKPASIASPARMILTPQIFPSNVTPSYSSPRGVVIVDGRIGRWLRPSSTKRRMMRSEVL